MTQSTGPIPRPLAHRWRDLRMRYLPALAYVTCAVLVVWLWDTHWMPGTFTGEVQASVANVASPMEGQLVSLSVRQFDHVREGQVLGEVTLAAEGVAASVAAIRTDLQVMQERMNQDQQRNAQNYQQLLAERMDQQADLDRVVFDLRYVESDLVRTQKLRSDEYIERLRTQVRERSELIEEMDRALAAMKPADSAEGDSAVTETIQAAISAQEDRLRESSRAVLRAPMDGVVTKVYRRRGEYISGGEVLVAISSEKAEHIIGFVRQPISFEPKVGDRVVVRTRRGSSRQAAEAQVVAVGARLELFTQPLRVRGFDSSQERGLPLLINVPQELALYPGELVDLTVRQ